MKQLIRPLLPTVVGSVLALSSLSSTAAISDSLTVFSPNGSVFASVSVDEANHKGADIIILDIPGIVDANLFGDYTAVVDPDGTLSDIFGINVNSGGAPVLAFESGSLASPIPNAASLLLGATFVVPEGSGFLDATTYLKPELQREGYTAQFFSDPGVPSSVPDTGATGAFLGVALTGIAFVRRKLSK